MRKRWRSWIGPSLVGLVLLPFVPWGYYTALGLLRGEHFYRGLPSTWWCTAVRAYIEGSILPPPCSRPAVVRFWRYIGLDSYPPILTGGDPEAVPVLTDMLQSRDVRIRLRALIALDRLGPKAKAAVPALLEVLRPELRGGGVLRETLEESTAIRSNVLQALTAIGPEAVPGLLNALSDPDAAVRTEVCYLLSQIPCQEEEGVVETLTETLQDPDWYVRVQAAAALYHADRYAARKAIPVLVQAVKNPRCNTGLAGRLLRDLDPEAAWEAGVR